MEDPRREADVFLLILELTSVSSQGLLLLNHLESDCLG